MAMDAATLGKEINSAIESKKFAQALPNSNTAVVGNKVGISGPLLEVTSMNFDSEKAQADMADAIATAVINHIINHLEIDLSKNTITVTVPSLTFSQGAGTAATPNTNPVPLTKVSGKLNTGIS